MRKILSKLMFTAAVLLALVYFLAGQKTFRISGAESIALSSPAEKTVTVSDPAAVKAVTDQLCSIRWESRRRRGQRRSAVAAAVDRRRRKAPGGDIRTG